MIKVNIEKNNKGFQILENQELLIRGIKPKWYSSQINFFYNSRTYQIKKKSFWNSSYNVFQGSKIVGVFNYKWKTGGYSLVMNDSKKTYSLTQSNTGGMWRIEKLYTLLEDGTKPVLTINYSFKKWKENIEIEKIDLSDSSLDLIIYSLFIMRRLQAAESAAVSPGVYG
ncbi:MAG: hypothetical protein ISQ43_04205 [Flavobacteriaceae bacterium]|nr:hypothetical protein [Flavobacteriaceae bacterium]